MTPQSADLILGLENTCAVLIDERRPSLAKEIQEAIDLIKRLEGAVPCSTDLAGLRQRAENCAKYDFDTVEMVECKWALWDEILEALNGPVGTMATVDDPRSAPAGYNKGSDRGHRTFDPAQAEPERGVMEATAAQHFDLPKGGEPINGEDAIREAAESAAVGANIVKRDGDLLVYYSGFNLSRFVRYLALAAPQPASNAYSSQQPRLAERLTDVITMLDAPDAYNREYIAAVCRSILSSIAPAYRGTPDA